MTADTRRLGTPGFESFVVETTRELVIDRSNDGGATWIHIVSLKPDTSVDYARVHLERYAKNYGESGPWRLVENVVETRTTKEVLEP